MRSEQHRQCTRKLCHSDYLSALKHAVHLGDETINIYSCPWCGSLHLGHSPDPLERSIRRTRGRIERRLRQLRESHHMTPDQHESLQQSVSDLTDRLNSLERTAVNKQKRLAAITTAAA